jgi:hypothetical protein
MIEDDLLSLEILRKEIVAFLESRIDPGTSIDCGFGFSPMYADLHPVIGGVEYHIQITPRVLKLEPLPVLRLSDDEGAA